MIARWKGIIKEINFEGSIKSFGYHLGDLSKKKNHLGPQNGPESLGTEKLLKIVIFQKTVLRQLE
jgi:hypothetical protein